MLPFRRSVQRSPRAAALLLLLAATAHPALAAGTLWIVSPTGCPGVHFAEIQPAVDAALDGDVILVRGRDDGLSYEGFTVNGKALAIVSDGLGPAPVGPVITIQNIGPVRSFLLQGISGEELVLSNNQGPLWIDGCDFTSDTSGNAAASVTSSASALFSRTILASSDGTPFTTPAEGLVTSASLVHLYDCTVSGGDGDQFFFSIPGKDGIVVGEDAVVFLIGSSVRGGSGERGFSSPSGCTAGLTGLDALVLGTRTSYALTLDSILVPGPGGAGGRVCGFLGNCSQICPDGPPGNELSGPGLRLPLVGSARSFVSTSPVRENDVISFSFLGEEGDLAVLFDSFAQQHVFWPQLNGVLGPALPGFAPFNGIIPASGTLDSSGPMTAATVDPGEAAVLYAQGLFLDALGVIYIGSPFAWVILDENHDPKDGCP